MKRVCCWPFVCPLFGWCERWIEVWICQPARYLQILPTVVGILAPLLLQLIMNCSYVMFLVAININTSSFHNIFLDPSYFLQSCYIGMLDLRIGKCFSLIYCHMKALPYPVKSKYYFMIYVWGSCEICYLRPRLCLLQHELSSICG